MKALRLTERQWRDLYAQLKKDYPPSVWMIRGRMKDKLGFTNREHTEWIEDGDIGSGYKTSVHLDFFNEQKRTMFLLKYSEFVQRDSED